VESEPAVCLKTQRRPQAIVVAVVGASRRGLEGRVARSEPWRLSCGRHHRSVGSRAGSALACTASRGVGRGCVGHGKQRR
jgi:hypothetical protein